jgi:CRISPR-associated protein Csb2
LFVPNNDGDRVPDRQERLTGKMVRPQYLLEGLTVHYLWALSDGLPAAHCIDVICRQTRHLLALGWGVDMVVGNGRVLNSNEAERLTGVRWKPWSDVHFPDQPGLRVPIHGSEQDLKQAYESFLHGDHRPPRAFDTVAYLPATALAPRPYAVFQLRNRDAWAVFRQEDACMVAAMLRHRACEAAKRDSHQFPGGSEVYVAGHLTGLGTPPRFSYIPLPSIGHSKSDGAIRRVLVAEPFGGDGQQARWASRRLHGSSLLDHRRGWRATLIWSDEDAVVSSYLGPSREWSSVTPIILPPHRPEKSDSLFLRSVQQAGLPQIDEFSFRTAPYWPKSEHPRCYRRPDYLRQATSWHVRVRFKDPVSGPLTLGSGRHCGLGVLACERSSDVK